MKWSLSAKPSMYIIAFSIVAERFLSFPLPPLSKNYWSSIVYQDYSQDRKCSGELDINGFKLKELLFYWW